MKEQLERVKEFNKVFGIEYVEQFSKLSKEEQKRLIENI